MANVCVIGASNVDICAFSIASFLQGDSNPGSVHLSLGGVGRNIAENVARIGHHVHLYTALGEDANAAYIKSACREQGITLTCLSVPKDARSSTYVAVHDNLGEMHAAVSDMAIYAQIMPEHLAPHIASINTCAAVIVEANLPEQTLIYLSEAIQVPLYADAVSVAKAPRLHSSLKHIDTLKCNRVEAALLSGVTISDTDSLLAASLALRNCGVKNVFITLGGEGAYYDDGCAQGVLPCYPLAPLCTTGCGDAFLSACVHAALDGKDVKAMATLGLCAASICSQSDRAVSPALTEDLLSTFVSAYNESLHS